MQEAANRVALRRAASLMNFKTVFDAARQGYAIWWFPAFGLIFVAVGALFVFAPTLTDQFLPYGPKGKARIFFNRFYLTFALIWTSTSFGCTYLDYTLARLSLKNEKYSVVEGPVTNFVPMPYSGHANENFTVNGQHFSYSDYIVTSGFNNTTSHGGPIREGLYVRVTYSGNTILRLEIAQ